MVKIKPKMDQHHGKKERDKNQGGIFAKKRQSEKKRGQDSVPIVFIF